MAHPDSIITAASYVAEQMSTYLEMSVDAESDFPQPLTYDIATRDDPAEFIAYVESHELWHTAPGTDTTCYALVAAPARLFRAIFRRDGSIDRYEPMCSFISCYALHTTVERLCDAVLDPTIIEQDEAGMPRLVTFSYRTRRYAP